MKPPRSHRRREEAAKAKAFKQLVRQQPTFSGVTRSKRREAFKHTKHQVKLFSKKLTAQKKKHRSWLRKHGFQVLDWHYSPLSIPHG